MERRYQGRLLKPLGQLARSPLPAGSARRAAFSPLVTDSMPRTGGTVTNVSFESMDYGSARCRQLASKGCYRPNRRFLRLRAQFLASSAGRTARQESLVRGAAALILQEDSDMLSSMPDILSGNVSAIRARLGTHSIVFSHFRASRLWADSCCRVQWNETHSSQQL